MKLIHLSDLHFGKRVNDYSMIEDQQHIVSVIMQIIDAEQPDGMILAGDIYDKPVPSAEAVELFDRFLSRLADGRFPYLRSAATMIRRSVSRSAGGS